LHGANYEPYSYRKDLAKLDELKPDYSMTNAGLYIQLPLRLIPRHNSLIFAFLACKAKGSENFIAVCLKRRTTNWRGFSPEAFDLRTLYSLPPEASGALRSPEAPSQPIWISKSSGPNFSPEFRPLLRQVVPQNVRYTVWFKAKKPCSGIPFFRDKSLDHSDADKKYMEVIENYNTPFDRSALMRFSSSKLPIQHFFGGTMPTSGFYHKVIAIRDSKINGDIAFAVMDQQIWVYVGESERNHKPSLSKIGLYSFPLGTFWNNPQHLYNGLLMFEPGGASRLKKNDNTAGWDVEVLTHIKTPTELRLTILVVADVWTSPWVI
jgi:hypothetical protein